jgi:hypothetical protein
VNKNDVLKIIAMLEVSYPQHYARLSKEQLNNQIMLWTELLVEDNANLIANAVKAIINGDPSPFPPNIGQIRNKAHELIDNSIDPQSAWNVLYKAICNSSYKANEEYEKLPEDIKLSVSPKMLREWATMDVDELNTVVASNWMRSFKERAKKAKDYQLLPNSIKAAIAIVSEQLKIE